MGVELRPYQREAVEAVEREWSQGRSRTLLAMATGTGKTVVFSEVAARAVSGGGRVLALAHRDELVRQAAAKLEAATGGPVGVEKASERSHGEPVVVGSVQTLAQPGRLEPLGEFTHVIVDEAHHAVAGTWTGVLDAFPGAMVLGVTATPDRSDRRALASAFDSIAYEYGLARAIGEGHLCRIVAKSLPVEVDARSLSVSHGDYTAASAGAAVGACLPALADAISREAAGRRTVVFLPLVETAERMAALLRERGLRAAEVDGASAGRAGTLARFASGELDALCNAMLLTEGWDCPEVDCIAVLRPTRSRAAYCQMVGRGTRLAPGKDHLLLLDFLWLTGAHRLCRPASLACGSPEAEARAQALLERGGGMDVLELAGRAERDVLAEREAALAAELDRRRRSRARLVDVVQFELSIGSEALASYEPAFAWELMEPTDKQVAALERRGVDPSGMTRGKAAAMLDVLAQRQAAGMATPKQVRALERAGFRHAGRWGFDEASEMMGRLAKAGWKPWKLGIDVGSYVPGGMAAEGE